jgi:hypothetical protein
VTGPKAEKAVAEMVAALYDASLDAYQPHGWAQMFSVWPSRYDSLDCEFGNEARTFDYLAGEWKRRDKEVVYSYRAFPAELTASRYGETGIAFCCVEGALPACAAVPCTVPAEPEKPRNMTRTASLGDSGERALFEKTVLARLDGRAGMQGGQRGQGGLQPDLDKVSARKNLQETAFFFPNLMSDANGVVKMEFTMPEALTEWKFLGFAHDRDLRSGFLTDKAVTAKDLMVEPNPPRFVREGDAIEFTVKVSNQSAARQAGTVRLSFSNARTLASVEGRLQPAGPLTSSRPGSECVSGPGQEAHFDIPSKELKTFSWRIVVPDGMGFLTYKAVGSTGKLSDGEEGYLPVLSRRILVTESLPLPIRGKQTKEFQFRKLLDSGKSDALKNQSLTLQMVSRPAWYAVMALPYLMEYPHACTEQTFNRLYANALAKYIADSDPKIRRVFDLWKGTKTLDSPMEKNQDLKAVMIEAFDEVTGDAAAVDACRVWLLKQKQTQDWKTTKATADAVYGLLLRGTDLLASDALVEVKLGADWIKPDKVEAGTGFYEQRYGKGEITPAMGAVTVKKTDEGVAWGSLHWQYLEDMGKVTPHEGTPLKLKKALFVKEHTAKGPVLNPVTGALAVGDELVTRVEVREDRDMEYVHLKDQRGSGTEPVAVLSQYKFQDGLYYYESTKDTASHFFLDTLPKGTYVFEYSVRVQHKGAYQSGMAEIQCLYAPEFNSHSESVGLVVE